MQLCEDFFEGIHFETAFFFADISKKICKSSNFFFNCYGPGQFFILIMLPSTVYMYMYVSTCI